MSLPCWELFELAARRLSQRGPAAGGAQASDGRGRRVARLGALGRATRVRSSASITSALSARGATVFEHFGFTPERIADVGRRVVRDGLRGRIPTVDHGHQPAGLGLAGPKLGHGGDAEPAR